ncbi:hypothetical protein AMQ84_01955 [Paenibacillus riograndensis]|uniref:Uncharacterized protein n=1 Tax=Paenibacillus riograndensis TaxID=483937 RepID=A0A132UB49_9BACL|nr:hypothetical protein AMQ84_01955 [Paenibacillus riograndensis]
MIKIRTAMRRLRLDRGFSLSGVLFILFLFPEIIDNIGNKLARGFREMAVSDIEDRPMVRVQTGSSI